MSENVIAVSDDEFESKVKKSDKAVLVDFWAPWCGPCKQIAPILEDVAGDYKGRLIVAKINVDDNTKYAGEYGVRGIPTLILFKNGEKVHQHVGALSKGQLTAFLDKNLGSDNMDVDSDDMDTSK